MSRPRALAAAAACLLGAGAEPAGAGGHDWLTSYADVAHSARLSEELVAPPFAVSWTYTVAGALREAPLVVGGDAYLVTRAFDVYALDAGSAALRWRFTGPSLPEEVLSFNPRTGAIRWRKALDGSVIHTHQAGRGLMLVGTDRGTLYALNQDDGREFWRRALPPPITLAAADPHQVVVGAGTKLVGLDLNTGAIRYEVGLGSPPAFFPLLGADGACIAAGDRVFAVDGDGTVRWRHAVAKGVCAPLALTADGVVAAGRDGTLQLLDRRRGAVLWEHLLAGTARFVAVAGPRVYAGTHQGRVVCLDARTGVPLWAVDAADRAGRPIEGLAPAQGRLMLSLGETARCLLPAPEPPADVLVDPTPAGDVLRWSPSAPNGSPVSGYVVWRHGAADGWTLVATTPERTWALPPGVAGGAESFALSAIGENGAQGPRGREVSRLVRELLLTRLQVTPIPFRPGHTPARATFRLREAARVTWRIFEIEGRAVTDERAAFLSPGPGAVEWDGRERDGRVVPPGRYEWRITAEAGTDHDAVARHQPVEAGIFESPGRLAGPASGGGPGVPPQGGGAGGAPGGTGAAAATSDDDGGGRGRGGVRDHGHGEGRDGAGQGQGRGSPHADR